MNKVYASVLALAFMTGNVIAQPSLKSGCSKVALGLIWFYQIKPVIKNRLNGFKITLIDETVEKNGVTVQMLNLQRVGGSITIQAPGEKIPTIYPRPEELPDYSLKLKLLSFVPGVLPLMLIGSGAREIYDASKPFLRKTISNFRQQSPTLQS